MIRNKSDQMDPKKQFCFCFLLILSNFVTQGYARKSGTEPSCYSTFDFQEKLLEKLVKLEHELTLLKESSDRKVKDIKEEVTSQTTFPEKGSGVAFHVNTIDTDSVVVGSPIVFTNVILNDGGPYNRKTGEFTAIQKGVYSFSVNICIYFQKWFQVQIITSSKTVVASASIYGGPNGGICTSSSGIVELNLGDSVWVKTTYYDQGGSYQDDRRHPTFSGVLLYAK